MSKIRDMIDLIADENFDGAKSALKATLAEYMAGRKFLSNRDLYGKDYTNPNEEEQSIKAGLSESTKKDVGDMADELIDAYDNPKKAQYIWEELEKETDDSGIYVADATPDDLIEYLVKAKPNTIKRLYDKFVKEQ